MEKPHGIDKGKLMRAFTLAVLAGATTACGTMHNIGESTSLALESTYYDVTGQDMVCKKTAQNGDFRQEGSNVKTTTNGAAGVKQDCISVKAQTKYEEARAKVDEVRATKQFELGVQLQNKRDAAEKERLVKQQELAKLRNCQAQELASLNPRGAPVTAACEKIIAESKGDKVPSNEKVASADDNKVLRDAEAAQAAAARAAGIKSPSP